jgi:hypothetical protein
MIRRVCDFLQKSAAALTGVGLALALSGPAQAVESYPQHRHHHYAQNARLAHNSAPSDDVVVHTGRVIFYPVDPYAEFLAGPHYYVDTALDTDPGLVHPFGHFGEATLPSRFNPPGQSAPLFTFW